MKCNISEMYCSTVYIRCNAFPINLIKGRESRLVNQSQGIWVLGQKHYYTVKVLGNDDSLINMAKI